MRLSVPSLARVGLSTETAANYQSTKTAAMKALHLAAVVVGMLFASSIIWYMQLMALSR
jgi:hypothetical protein